MHLWRCDMEMKYLSGEQLKGLKTVDLSISTTAKNIYCFKVRLFSHVNNNDG